MRECNNYKHYDYANKNPTLGQEIESLRLAWRCFIIEVATFFKIDKIFKW
jgi:hypothetical protein